MILVTGRIFDDLEASFPGLWPEFDALVTENGAVLHTEPARGRWPARSTPPCGASWLTVGCPPALADGQQRLCPRRRWVQIGTFDDGQPVLVPGSQGSVLIAGDSGADKSYLTGLLAERWIDAGYAVLILDPGGDHVGLTRRPGVHLVDAAVPGFTSWTHLGAGGKSGGAPARQPARALPREQGLSGPWSTAVRLPASPRPRRPAAAVPARHGPRGPCIAR